MVETKFFHEEESPPFVPAASAPCEEMLFYDEPAHLDDEYPVVTIDGPVEEHVVLDDEDDEERERSLILGAGVAAGTMGCLIGGPLLACLAGFGAAHYAKKEGACGDCARAIGQVALVARMKAVEINRKHNLVEKSKQAAGEAWEKAKDMDRRHNILERTRASIVSSLEALKEANRKHRILQRTADGLGRLLSFVGRKISEALLKEEHPDSQGSAAADGRIPTTSFASAPPKPQFQGVDAVTH